MAESIAVIDVVVPAAPVVSVTSIGVQGPPGTPGAEGPAGPAGPQGPAGVAGPHQASHAVGGSDPVTGPLALDPYVSVGVNPSQSGAVRLPNDAAANQITIRNAANTADIRVAGVWTNDAIYLGDGNASKLVLAQAAVEFPGSYVTGAAAISVGVNPAQGGAVRLPNSGEITARNTANSGDLKVMQTWTDDKIYLGSANPNIDAGLVLRSAAAVTIAAPGGLRLAEQVLGVNPGANEAMIWLQDNGAGKSQLMIQFATGVPIAIATQV